MKMSKRGLSICAYLYLSIPAFIFFVGWLKWPIAFLFSALLLVGLVFALRYEEMNYGRAISFRASAGFIMLVALVMLATSFISGAGGFYYQSYDYHWRNAVFNDLVRFDWPVIFPGNGAAQVYYIGYWLPAALVAKSFGALAGNVALLLWSFAGLFIAYFLLYENLGILGWKRGVALLALMLLFSGCDALGAPFGEILNGTAFPWIPNHLEWWSSFHNYLSNLTQIMWVFNQSLAAWICVGLLLRQRQPRNLAFIGLLLMPYGPLALIGFVPFAVGKGIIILVRQLKRRRSANPERLSVGQIVKSYLSIPNVIALFSLLVVFALFYTSSSILSYESTVPSSAELYPRRDKIILAVFYLVEFLLYVILIAPKYRKDPLFWLIPAVLILLPNFTVGEGRDLEMKASIPALFLLMYYIGRYIIRDDMFKDNRHLLRNCLLIALLAIGCMTPLTEQTRAVKAMWEQKKLSVTADDIPTLSTFGEGQNNFMSRTYRDSIFFKYFAKDAEKADSFEYLKKTDPETFKNCEQVFASVKKENLTADVEIWMNYETGGYYTCSPTDDLVKARFSKQYVTMDEAFDHLRNYHGYIIIYRNYYDRLVEYAAKKGEAEEFLQHVTAPDQNEQWILILKR